MVYRLILSYRGTRYAGWQRQPNALAVQQVVEEALEDLLRQPAKLVGASRTDAGVHARGQAAHLELPAPFAEPGLVHGTNHRLPPDIRVLSAHRMREGFHARKHAVRKRYLYRVVPTAVLSPLDSLFAIAVPERLDLTALDEATALLPGRHDFTAFALSGGAHTQPFRTIHLAGWERRDAGLRFVVEGDGFLRGSVRGMVGTLLEVARGRRSVREFAALLSGKPRSAAGATAPALGLVLDRVFYGSEWEADFAVQSS